MILSFPRMIRMPRLIIIFLILFAFSPAMAAVSVSDAAWRAAEPHRAIYNVDLVATRGGAQVINIRGKMFYEWDRSCDAWVTNHRFNLVYDYADSPGMRVSSDFATYESKDGQDFHFSSRRSRDGALYQDLRGHSNVRRADFTSPEGLSFDLPEGVMFPSAHTLQMIDHMQKEARFFSAVVFDGSDEEGPIEINSFFGPSVNPMKLVAPSDRLDMSLLNTPARRVHMAVFPVEDTRETASYEMSLVFHENGVISDMTIDYDEFSVRQTLVALERIEPSCGRKESPDRTLKTR